MPDSTTSFSLSPCLFIGIGTNGWRILDDLRQLFFEEFGVGGLPCFRYIAIESNAGRLPDDSFLPHVPKPFETRLHVQRPVTNDSTLKVLWPDVNKMRAELNRFKDHLMSTHHVTEGMVVGGLGSLEGAMVGALIVGLLRETAISLFPELELAVLYLIAAIVLLVRPAGLFGRAT